MQTDRTPRRDNITKAHAFSPLKTVREKKCGLVLGPF